MRCRLFPLLSVAFAMAVPLVGQAGDWSDEAPVRDGSKRIMNFRARLAGGYLVVQAVHEPGWHSYAMDNSRREAEKLAGRPSLGVEQGIQIAVESGGKTVGPWYQTTPRDLSKPELQWYTWGFDATATFACRLERTGDEPVVLSIGGQACDGQTCRPIEVALKVSGSTGEPAAAFRTEDLVEVRAEPQKPADPVPDSADPAASPPKENRP